MTSYLNIEVAVSYVAVTVTQVAVEEGNSWQYLKTQEQVLYVCSQPFLHNPCNLPLDPVKSNSWVKWIRTCKLANHSSFYYAE